MVALTMIKVIKLKELPSVNDREKVFEIYPKLVKFLRTCATAYYDDSRPLISDGEYDDLMDRLFDYEQVYPMIVDPKTPTRCVGAVMTIRNMEEAFNHKPPMLSQGKVNELDDLKKWFDNSIKTLRNENVPLKDIHVSLEEKLDGISLRVVYVKGVLKHVALRGDGSEGIDLINHIKLFQKRPEFKITGLPLRLLPTAPDPNWDMNYHTDQLDVPELVDVCGELVVTADDFKKLNKLLILNHKAPYPTPRHAAGALVNLRSFGYLTFILHTVNSCAVKNGRSKEEIHNDYSDDLRWLQIVMHFRTIWSMNLSAANKHCWDRISEELGFMEFRRKLDPDVVTDGAVLKFTNKEQRQILGKNRKHPKWSIAFKFPSEVSTTILTSVQWQIGRSGVLTPVANMEPVTISNVTITKASLHNPNIIRNLDLHIGDTVFIQRANEVIPKILGVVTELRSPDAIPVPIPEECPHCKEPITLIGKTAQNEAPHCLNRSCPGRVLAQLLFCATRQVFNLKYVGERLITEMFETGLVTRPEHFFLLSENLLREKIHCTETQITLILDAVVKTRKRLTPTMMLLSLSIPDVSKAACDELFEILKGIDDINPETLSRMDTLKDKVFYKNLVAALQYPEVVASLAAYRQMVVVEK